MNKSQLVDALADRLGDRRTAATAVDALLQIVVDTVRSGDAVSIAGFGVFESRSRAARTGRNPRTGETVAVPATTVPAFRPGSGFRSAVAGEEPPAQSRVAATNGAGPRATEALNGAVELTPATTTLLAEPPAEAAAPAKAKTKSKPAAKPATKDAGKAAAKATAKNADKKKGKKGKK